MAQDSKLIATNEATPAAASNNAPDLFDPRHYINRELS